MSETNQSEGAPKTALRWVDVSVLAGLMYEAYCKDVGGVAFNGDPLPTWAQFRVDPAKMKQALGWHAAARAAINYTLTPS